MSTALDVQLCAAKGKACGGKVSIYKVQMYFALCERVSCLLHFQGQTRGLAGNVALCHWHQNRRSRSEHAPLKRPWSYLIACLVKSSGFYRTYVYCISVTQ